jgi:hypothetical protein
VRQFAAPPTSPSPAPPVKLEGLRLTSRRGPSPGSSPGQAWGRLFPLRGGEGLCPRFVSQKGVTKHLEQPCLALAAGATKGVNGRADPDIDETALLEDMPPACARQATGNSVRPQIDIAERACRNFLAVRDVGKL